ncbi:hypothetical protein OJAV_G00012920 [Oryzias javanicus]|uniref:Uncharacterized protein n=1 Tax=Oryzias javanicus TaxID=123683 RepID=A0A3S2N771_ORYJA|nr:hypothetical protein OJAV_G00012920 [Oryzias javanicus]
MKCNHPLRDRFSKQTRSATLCHRAGSAALGEWGELYCSRSDKSKDFNPDFKSISPGVKQVDQQSSETPSGPSVQQHQTQLDSIFLLLEDNIVTFVKKELKKIQKLLSQREDEEEDEDEEQRSSRESVMKITENFLRRMKQEELADRLQSRSAAAVCRPKVQSGLKKKFQGGSSEAAASDQSLQQSSTEKL